MSNREKKKNRNTMLKDVNEKEKNEKIEKINDFISGCRDLINFYKKKIKD